MSPRVGRLQAQLVLLFKKGDRGQCTNWCGTSLLTKVLSRIMTGRLHTLLGQVSAENQNGFMRGRGCADAAFSAPQALRKSEEHGLACWTCSIDLIRAFDSVPREVPWACVSKLGVGPEPLDALKRLREGVTIEVDVDGASPLRRSALAGWA